MKRLDCVVIPANLSPQPTVSELSAAYILAKFFQEDVEFVLRASQKTPDFKIGRIYWELKSPTGSGKHNIQHALQYAARQSRNVVFDARNSKMHISRIRRELLYQASLIHGIKKLLLIEKNGKVVAIK